MASPAVFSPEDGRRLGLQGMINVMLEECDFPTVTAVTDEIERLASGDVQAIARLITLCEYRAEGENKEAAAAAEAAIEQVKALEKRVPVLGITGTGGAGKSSLTDELVRRFLNEIPDIKIAILSVDPTKQKTGRGAVGRPHPDELDQLAARLHEKLGDAPFPHGTVAGDSRRHFGCQSGRI